MIVIPDIPDNARVNSLVVCATDTGTASVRYFGESRLATLFVLEPSVLVPVGLLVTEVCLKHLCSRYYYI